jgi:hypothetical protein
MDFVQVTQMYIMCWREALSTVFLISGIALSPRGGNGNTWSALDAHSGRLKAKRSELFSLCCINIEEYNCYMIEAGMGKAMELNLNKANHLFG